MSIRRHGFFLLCLLAGVPFAAAAAADETAARLAQQVQANQQRYGSVGQAVAISHNGRELFRAVAGLADAQSGRPVRADDIFPVFSLSKLFVSTLVMQLVEQGKVGLDQPAGRYLPDLPQRWHAITLRQFTGSAADPGAFGDSAL